MLIVAQIYEDKIGVMAVKSINKLLKAPLTVEYVDLTLIQTFPKASVILNGVSVPDTRGGILLNAKTMYLQFGIMSIFKDEIDIQSVLVSNGSLNVLTDKKGVSNYDVFFRQRNKRILKIRKLS
ncbi:MAG: hypothetical protein HC803_05555 [Saprospiraceae bacterium]|nr:hypothetical protein [Saprospiraceae bacterium]